MIEKIVGWLKEFWYSLRVIGATSMIVWEDPAWLTGSQPEPQTAEALQEAHTQVNPPPNPSSLIPRMGYDEVFGDIELIVIQTIVYVPDRAKFVLVGNIRGQNDTMLRKLAYFVVPRGTTGRFKPTITREGKLIFWLEDERGKHYPEAKVAR